MNKRGVVLIICYVAIMVLTILGAAFLTRSISERSVASEYYYSTQAFWLAEAGIQQSLWELNHNNCAGCSPCGANRCVSGTLSGGSYIATISSGNTTITSTGSFPNATVQRTVMGTLNPSQSVFQYGIFSSNTISFSNSASTDSYDSSRGDYNALLPDGTHNVGKNGDVGTDSTAAGAITLNNSAIIKGDAGVGGDPVSGIQPPPPQPPAVDQHITGSRNGGVNIDFPAVPVPTPPAGSWSPCTVCKLTGTDNKPLASGSYSATVFSLSNSSQLNINGDVTLYITGDFALQNSSQLKISSGGNLTLYVDGTFSIGNSAQLNNVTKIPNNLTFYSRYSQPTGGVNFANSGSLYGTVYAPQTHVDISNSFEIYGALVAKSTSLFNSTKIHYDEVLKNRPTPFATSTYSIQNWREQQNSNSQSPF